MKLNENYDTWIFDLDGTLAATKDDIVATMKQLFADGNIECPDFDEKFVIGPSLDEMLKIFFPDLPAEDVKDIREEYIDRYSNSGFPLTKVYPGMTKLVKELYNQDKRLFVVTNKEKRATFAMLKKLGLADMFSGVLCPDCFDPIRSKAELVKTLIEDYDLDVEHTVMVGDRATDIQAAQEAGIASIGVTWGYGTEEELRDAEPDEIWGVRS